MRVSMSSRSISVLSGALIASCPIVVNAAGFALLEQSASRLGTAFAGTAAAADDATTIFFNPAGLTRLERPQAVVAMSGIEITSEFSNTGSTPALSQPLGGSGGDAGDWNLVPSAYLSWPINDALSVGIGVGAPFGLKLEYANGWVGRFQAHLSEIKTYNVNPSIAWQISDRVSIGAGVSYQKIQAELTNAVNYSAVVAGGVQQLVSAGQLSGAAGTAVVNATYGLEGGGAVRGDDTAWTFNLGVLFELTDATRIGLSYRTGPDYEVEGTVNFAAPAIANPVGAAIVAAASAPGGAVASGPVSVDLELPDLAIASLHHQIGDRFALLADIAWTSWSTVEELRVVREDGAPDIVTPEEWDDSFRYALGATFDLSDAVTLRAGVGYDETPVPDRTRTPRLPDPDRTWAAIGARWQPNESMQIDVGYAHLFSDDVPLNHTTSAAASGVLVGNGSSDIDILTAQLVWQF